jgi:folate-binding protein YgfZ
MSVDTNITTQTERAYHALYNGAVVVNRSDRLRMLFTGDKAVDSLTGLVTNDVAALKVGQGQYAAALTNKGKVLADVRIFSTAGGGGGGLLVDASAAAGTSFAAMVKKFVNPRLAKYQDISQQSGDTGVFGPGSLDLLNTLVSGGISHELEPYGHVLVDFADTKMMVARVPDFGVDGYDIIGPREVIDQLQAKLVSAGAIDEASEALNIARIEAGRPVWGIDMDDSVLAQEMDMDRLGAISYTKGCYTGQETVARVHYRGHVNRLLRGLHFEETILPPTGSPIADESGKEIGSVKSGALSPRRGAIALALIRREVEPGTMVRVGSSGQQSGARVVELPFRD